jgi:hypothetical protein
LFKRSLIEDQIDPEKPGLFTLLVMEPMVNEWRTKQQPHRVFDKKGMGTGNFKGKQFFTRQ